LSLFTVGSGPYWQDSGFFLSGIREGGILYPHGFVLYLGAVRLWTALLFPVDFTLAVHLFSALCAALASAALALGARVFLVARSPRWGLGAGGELDWVDGAAAGAGVLAAGGYTFWFSGLYAKPYAFYYLILSLLLWRLACADQGRRPRDFTVVAVLIGLAWQAHPSSVLLGPALLAFAGAHRATLGWRGLAWRSALAAAIALGPVLALPGLAARDPLMAFGHPERLTDLLEYVLGRRFTRIPGAFGVEPSRLVQAGRFLGEEFLVAGSALFLVGLWQVGRRCPWALGGLLLWTLPGTIFAVLFKLEGQLDHWLLAVCLPFHWLVAAGLLEAGRWARRRGRWAIGGIVTAGMAGCVLLNAPGVVQRGYRLAELFARIQIEPLERGALLLAISDDTTSLGHYLQIVRGVREDVLLIRASHLGSGASPEEHWYDRTLRRRFPWLVLADYEGMRRRFPRSSSTESAAAAFANANVSPDRPVYFEAPPSAALLRPDYALIPAGPLWKLVPRGQERIDPALWKFPIEPEQVLSRFRRERAQSVTITGREVWVHPEAYEHRLFYLLLRARVMLADWYRRHGEPEKSLELYESTLRVDPPSARVGEIVYSLARVHRALGHGTQAEEFFRRTLGLGPPPAVAGDALASLGELARERGDLPEAARHFEAALRLQDLEAPLRHEIERRANPK
jgi:tetratricopeptide (TPR) repeat protein